jgi:hypothetical protein
MSEVTRTSFCEMLTSVIVHYLGWQAEKFVGADGIGDSQAKQIKPMVRSTFGAKDKEHLNNFRTVDHPVNPANPVSMNHLRWICTVIGACRYFPAGTFRRTSSKKLRDTAI